MALVDPHPGQNVWRYRSIFSAGGLAHAVNVFHFKVDPSRPAVAPYNDLTHIRGNFRWLGPQSLARRDEFLCVHGPDQAMFAVEVGSGSEGYTGVATLAPLTCALPIFGYSGPGHTGQRTQYHLGPIGLRAVTGTGITITPPAYMCDQARLTRFMVSGISPFHPTIRTYFLGRFTLASGAFAPFESCKFATYWATQQRRRQGPYGPNTPWPQDWIKPEDE
jgi:hypothetical protein